MTIYKKKMMMIHEKKKMTMNRNKSVDVCFICFAIFTIAGCYIDCYRSSSKTYEEYSLKEWKVDYKITTTGEISDTTVVLTKIK